MAVKIRLMRMGKRHEPFFRLVVADSRAPRNGRYIESIGYYNPRTEPSTIHVNAQRALEWLSKGAQPSDAARVLLEKTGVWRLWQEQRRRKAG
ncbi:MAG: 30S ribosomal protein S16 [Armatimonadota bacterium]|nr:30S ribosomal protein S16 [Armatimonadota bacterium]MDR7439886.1 30S ribosomal protein S16 [Armatimonadota bacterium]MDR7563319.1 30S ribosomal protein S16 [Armatimonadota bacterium]MDR7567473.1 30S ribosomal protein S16 [Armatimonadota bacterium]MDR7601978.1 30S ribosomal protein S16 [Armatimonadota bacterium]